MAGVHGHPLRSQSRAAESKVQRHQYGRQRKTGGGLRRFEGGEASEREGERARALCSMSAAARGRAQRGVHAVSSLLRALFLSFRVHPPFKGRLNVIREAPETGHYRNEDRRGEGGSPCKRSYCLEGLTANKDPVFISSTV